MRRRLVVITCFIAVAVVTACASEPRNVSTTPIGENFINPYTHWELHIALDRLRLLAPTTEINLLTREMQRELDSVYSWGNNSLSPWASRIFDASSKNTDMTGMPSKPVPLSCLKLVDSQGDKIVEREDLLVSCLREYDQQGEGYSDVPLWEEKISTLSPLTQKTSPAAGEMLADAIRNLPPDIEFQRPRFQCLNDRGRCRAAGEGWVICGAILAACLVFGE